MPADLIAARDDVRSGRRSARARVEAAIDASEACPAALVLRRDADARAAADAADRAVAASQEPGPLAGLPVSVKDLFDIAGEVTRAGSPALADAPEATHDAVAVARLRAAGAALASRTHMPAFAFSGVGQNPHLPRLDNPVTRALDPTPRAPGGSTSGGAASVATGSSLAALGSDTGGSIRIPAALQGLVGFKCTQRRVPLDGAVPLSTTLDTVCAITRSVRDAVLLHAVLAARPVEPTGLAVQGLRIAVPTTLLLDGADDRVAAAFDAALATLSRAGARVETVALPALAELAAINAKGGYAAAESWAWHRERLAARAADYDPRVALRIRRGEAISGADLRDLAAARRHWQGRVAAVLARCDVMASPTVPIVAPPLEPLLADDDAFFATNALLLRNPSAVNFLDGCALSLPCHAPGDWPVGLMLWQGAEADERVLGAGLAVEAALAEAGRGGIATGRS